MEDRYIILEAIDTITLERLVEDKMKDGFEIAGGAIPFVVENCFSLFQTMIKRYQGE